MDEMVKKGGRENFMQLILHYILIGENFIGEVKVSLYSVCLNPNHEKTNQ